MGVGRGVQISVIEFVFLSVVSQYWAIGKLQAKRLLIIRLILPYSTPSEVNIIGSSIRSQLCFDFYVLQY